MAILQKSSQTLAAYKKANKIKTITVLESRKGNYYAVDENGEFLASVQKDIDQAEPIVVLHMENDEVDADEAGREWYYICNFIEKKVVFTL